jgi:hypothetical protein
MKNNVFSQFKNYVTKAAMYSLIPLTIAFSSCEKPKDPIQPQTNTPTSPTSNNNSSDNSDDNSNSKDIYDNVFIFDNSNLSNINYYDYETIGFDSPQDFKVGDIIEGGVSDKTPYGFLNKITFVTPDKKSFKLEKNTSLDEVLINGEGSFSKDLKYNDLASKTLKSGNSIEAGKGYYNFHVDVNRVIYDHDGNLNTKEDQAILRGSSDFNINTSGRVKFKDGGLYVKFQSAISGESNLKIYTNLENMSFEKKIPIEEYYFNPITFSIGVVPVVVVPKAGLYFKGKLDLNSKLDFEALDNFHSGASLVKENGLWVLTKDPRNHNDIFISKNSTDFDASLRASLSPEVSLDFYGFAGPYANVDAYLNFNADISEDPWWTLSGGIDANIGFDATKISKKIGNYQKTITLVDEYMVADAGGPFSGGGSDDNKNLDSLVIQPGPEGTDAWVRMHRWPNLCEDTYSSSGEDKELFVSYSEFPESCGFIKEKSLLLFPFSKSDLEKEVTSAKLKLYGHVGSNYVGVNPSFKISKLTNSWNESLGWEDEPETAFVSSSNLEGKTGESWNSFDVTSAVQAWAQGEPNNGLEISTDENLTGGRFYSGDNSDSGKRPKLVIYFKR